MIKVWLVPDTHESQASLSTLLHSHGYEVEIVSVETEAALHAQLALPGVGVIGAPEQQAEEQTLARVRQQASIAELGALALTDIDLESLMGEAVRQVSIRLEVDLCKVLELLPSGQALLLRSGMGWMEGKVGAAIVEAGPGSLAGLSLTDGRPVVFEDILHETRFDVSKLLAEHGVISGVSVLIGSKEKPFGILGAFSRSRRLFNLDEIHFVRAVANILAATVELHSSEEKYRRLFDLESDALLLIEKESGRILEANSAAVALYGYKRAELLRMANTDLSGEPELTRRSIQIEETNIPVRLHQKKDGSIFPVEVTASHFVWYGQSVQLAAIREITSRVLAEKQIVEARDFYLQVLREAPALIWRSNAEGICDWYNDTWLRFTGRTFEQEIGGDWKALIHPDDREKVFQSYLQVYDHGQPFENEYRLQNRDGDYHWILEVGQPLTSQEGHFLGFLGYCFDITDRKQQEQIREQNLRWQQLTAEIAMGFNQAAAASLSEQIDIALKRLAEFLDVDRVGIGVFSSERELRLLNTWSKPGIPPMQTEYLLEKSPYIEDLLKRGKPVRLSCPDDLPESAGLDRQFYQFLGLLSLIVVPLFVGERLYGVLSLSCLTGEHEWPDDLVERIELFGELFVHALIRMEAEQQLRQRTEELRMLYEAGRQLTSTLDLNIIYETVYQIVSQTMNCSGLFVSSYEPADRFIRCVFGMHDGGKLNVSEFPPIPLEDEGRGTQSLVIRSGETLIINDYRSRVQTARTTYYVDKKGITELDVGEDTDLTRSALIVPLKLEGNVLGVIQVFSYQDNAFNGENARFLESLALQTVAAMQNASLYQRAQAEIAERKRSEEALRVLSNASILFADLHRPLSEILQKLVELIPSGLQYSGQACARLVLAQQIYQTTNFYAESRLLSCPININSRPAGRLEVGYPLLSDGEPARPFLEDEIKLLNTLVRQLGNALERRQADETLRENEYKFRAIFNHHYQLTALLNLQGRMLAVNPAAQKFNDVSEYELIGKLFWLGPWWGHSADLQEQVHQDVLRAARGEFINHETTHIDANGELHHIDFSINPILDEKGKVIYLVPEGRDITHRKQAEEQLRASLAEKEVLLREIHHRVKNNLEVIISLADLQARTISDSQALQSIRELQERVRTIALVHEDLYRSKNLAHIRAQPYLLRLVDNLFQVFGSAGIDLQVEAADLSFNVDSAIPCGLIVTELVTNAIKHAFPTGLDGTDVGKAARPKQIRVSLSERDGQFVLEVCDNGVGLPPDLDWQTTRSLGLRLVNRLAGQLHGVLDVDFQNGARFRLAFPKPD